MKYIKRNEDGSVVISNEPGEGRDAVPDDDPEILAIYQRQQDDRAKAAEAAPAKLLQRIAALEAKVERMEGA